jgi:hypothetical protein
MCIKTKGARLETRITALVKHCPVQIGGNQDGSYYKGKSSFRACYQTDRSCGDVPVGYIPDVGI